MESHIAIVDSKLLMQPWLHSALIRQRRINMKALYIVLIGLFLAGCGPSPVQLTATAVMAKAQTQTAAPTLTLTPTCTPTLTPTSTPTSTLTPTPTPRPTNTPTPTPAAIGNKVKFDYLPIEITVLWAQTHSHVVPGGSYYYYAKTGYTFVELGVLVRNTETKPVNMVMKDIFLLQDNDSTTTFFPYFSASKTVEVDTRFAPLSLKIPDTLNTGNENISFEKDTYLRLIFYVKDNHDFFFGILNSPKITIDVKNK